MRRLFLVFAAAVCMAACSPGNAPIEDPPARLAGGVWLRRAVERPSLNLAPEAVQPFRPKQWLRTEYAKGDSIVKLEVFLMPGETVAFEARQKWLGQSHAVSMNHRDLFLVATSATEPPQSLGQFLRLMEAEWLSAPAR